MAHSGRRVARIQAPGRLAQLGEHQLDKLGVTGSSPVPPIEESPGNGAFAFSEETTTCRGVGPDPPSGGYRPGDIIFFGHVDGPTGHDALWLGNGQIVQCSSSGGGSNIRPLDGYVAPTGWVRWSFASAG